MGGRQGSDPTFSAIHCKLPTAAKELPFCRPLRPTHPPILPAHAGFTLCILLALAAFTDRSDYTSENCNLCRSVSDSFASPPPPPHPPQSFQEAQRDVKVYPNSTPALATFLPVSPKSKRERERQAEVWVRNLPLKKHAQPCQFLSTLQH